MNSNNFWKNKNVIVTGHTGFKGSWLVNLLKYLDSNIVGISREKYEGIYKLSSVSQLLEDEIFIDISKDIDIPEKLFKSFQPDIVFHFAGQSLVPVGYSNPLDTINTNIVGTYNVLNYFDKFDSVNSIVVSTTDKVYLNPNNLNVETSTLGGKDYYGASKASAEFIISSFLNNNPSTNISVVRSGNVLGGGDRAFKRLVPDLIKAIKLKQDFEIRQPNSVRPWQYVLDSLLGYLYVAEENYTNSISEVYNLNSSVNNQYTAGYIVDKFNKIWGTNINIIESKDKSFKEVDILNLDSSKAKDKLNWSPKLEIEDLIELIVNWEKAHIKDIDDKYTLNEINNYFSLFN